LDNYVAPGSTITVIADESFEESIKEVNELQNQKLLFRPGDTTDRSLLDELNVADFDHVIALADVNLEAQEADARTLITLLQPARHLRKDSNRSPS